MAQQYISGRHPWSWLQTREVLQSVVDKTAGTVAITSGTTTVTGTGTAFAASDVGSFIQFGANTSGNDWYRITTFTSATSIAIEANYAGTTNLTAATYTIRKWYYALSSAVDRIIQVRQAITPVRLYPMQFLAMSRWTPMHSITGNPYAYAAAAQDAIYSSGTLDAVNVGNWAIQLYPWPSTAMNYEVDYYRTLTDLSANGDTGLIPSKMRDTVLIDGSVAYTFAYLNDPRYQQYWQKFEEGIERFWQEDGQDRGQMNVIEAVDNTTQDPDIIRFPSSYPFVDGY